MIDLHTHSNVSDGTDTPRALINKAHSAGITVLALTDHDSVGGWDEARKYLRPGMDLVLGAEISCQTPDGVSVHMLGLLFDRENQALASAMAQTRENRVGRMERIISRMNENGIEITLEEVYAQLSEGGTLGRPHYIAHYSPTPEEAIALIKGAGGVAVIAHPLASLRGRTIEVESFASYVAAGMDGIEISHRDHSPAGEEILQSVVKEFDLIPTGSSDYHGDGKLNQLAENQTDPAQWERLQARAVQGRVIRL